MTLGTPRSDIASLGVTPPVPVAGTTPSVSSGTSRPTSGKPTLRQGDSGAEVRKLQRLLAARGVYKGEINGQFDKRLRTAVSQFQKDQGIRVDNWGTYGPKTRKVLEE
ncbi:peptidoglycan-binding protein [Streptomyces sp. NBC_00513]